MQTLVLIVYLKCAGASSLGTKSSPFRVIGMEINSRSSHHSIGSSTTSKIKRSTSNDVSIKNVVTN